MLKRVLAVFEPFILLLLGTVVLASLLPPRGRMADVVEVAATVGIVLLFFLHGARLSQEAIVAGARHWRLHLAVLATTFVLFPLLGLGMAALPFISSPIAGGLLFLAVLPSTVQSSIAFTAMARGNVAAAVCSASFSNLLGIAITPALVALLMPAMGHGAGVSFASVEKIVLQLLVPFVVGHLLRPWIGGFVTRHRTMVARVDRGSILLVVYAAFGAAVAEGLWRRVAGVDLAVIAGASVVLLAVVLGVTWQAGRLMGLERGDRIVLLFCGSKKSLAAGVPMAGTLFAPAQVGLMLLPVMLFHQLQLVACALIARRMGEGQAD